MKILHFMLLDFVKDLKTTLFERDERKAKAHIKKKVKGPLLSGFENVVNRYEWLVFSILFFGSIAADFYLGKKHLWLYTMISAMLLYWLLENLIRFLDNIFHKEEIEAKIEEKYRENREIRHEILSRIDKF